DIMKRWLMEVDPDFITWAFQKGIMSDNELKSMQGGQKLKITAKSLIQKVLSAGLFKLPALLGVAKVAGNARKAESHAKTIPLKFNEEKIAVWEKKLEKFFIK
ncbi:MAG: hypothetical protein FWD49_05880, partial [Firmicutes bacterium]|nr:hypothetical protein [Bacillota bacterium]